LLSAFSRYQQISESAPPFNLQLQPCESLIGGVEKIPFCFNLNTSFVQLRYTIVLSKVNFIFIVRKVFSISKCKLYILGNKFPVLWHTGDGATIIDTGRNRQRIRGQAIQLWLVRRSASFNPGIWSGDLVTPGLKSEF